MLWQCTRIIPLLHCSSNSSLLTLRWQQGMAASRCVSNPCFPSALHCCLPCSLMSQRMHKCVLTLLAACIYVLHMRLLSAGQMLLTVGTARTINSTSQLAQLTHMVYQTPRRSAQDAWCMITAISTTSLSCMDSQHTISSAALHSHCSITCADCIINSYVFKSQGQQTAVNQLVCHSIVS